MEDNKIDSIEKEIVEMYDSHSLSIEQMLRLARHVKTWKATCVYRHKEKQYSHIEPTVTEFQGRLGRLTLDLESSSANSLSRWYSLIVSTPLNILGSYKEKESKCVPELVKIYSDLELKYAQEYFKRVKHDMESGFEEARRLLNCA